MFDTDIKILKNTTKGRNQKLRFELENTNINVANTSKQLKAIFDKVYFHTFGTYYGINKEDGMLYIGVNLDVRYIHYGGGSNGTDLLRIVIREDGKHVVEVKR